MNYSKSFFTLMLFVLVLFFAISPVLAEEDQHIIARVDLFESMQEISLSEHSKMVGSQILRDNEIASVAMRVARVEFNQEIAEGLKVNPGTAVTVQLFDDDSLEARIEQVESDLNNITGMIGSIEDNEYGFLISSALDGKVLTVIELPDLKKQYQVVYDSQAEEHFLYEFNLHDLDRLPSSPAFSMPDDENFAFSGTGNPDSGNEGYVSSQSVATIDVMIVYTANARIWANANATGINYSISQAMQRAQLVANNSNIFINFNLIHSGEIPYQEYTGEPIWYEPWNEYLSGSDVDLFAITLGLDGCEMVPQWRDQHGADLVALFSRVEDTGGLGWALDDPKGSPILGHSLTRIQQAHNSYTHVHEMGHNMGAGHHKQQNVQPGPQMHSYSAGWRWGYTAATRKCSVMAYQEGRYYADGHDHVEVAHFSNPNVTLGGFATGHPQHGDNARTLRDMRFIIASYRHRPAAPPPPGPEGVTLSASVASPSLPGQQVIFTANTTGMTNPRFQFWYEPSRGKWTKLGGMTSTNYISYNFPSTWSGRIGVQALGQGSSKIRTDWISHSVSVPPVTGLLFTANPPQQARPDQEVRFVAQALGGYNPEYAFYYRLKGDSKWHKLFDYQAGNVLIIKNLNREMDIEVGVMARSKGSKNSYEARNSLNYRFRWNLAGFSYFDQPETEPGHLEIFVTKQ